MHHAEDLGKDLARVVHVARVNVDGRQPDEGGPEHNTPAEYIANLSGGVDKGNYLKLTAGPTGNFAVFNPRTQETKNYSAK